MSQKEDYFYRFLAPISKELAVLARDLEYSIFTSPRMMLTHARTFAEDIVHRVLKTEGISDLGCDGLKDRIMLLQSHGILSVEAQDAVHEVRKSGNHAAHNTRTFRYSEALMSWEALYRLVKWFVEKYRLLDFEMPDYQEPSIDYANKFDAQELEFRLNQWEESILYKFSKIAEQFEGNVAVQEQVAVTEEVMEEDEIESSALPGETTLRSITYKGEGVEIPFFLRDAFLLPQRFEKSERFMIALGGVQQARIMSELPSDLEGMSSYVKRYKEENDALLFHDIRKFVEEEKIRRKIMQQKLGELLIFFRSEYIILTNTISKIPLTEEYFQGFPNFLRQMQKDGINKVGQLPQELLILAKYDRVGIGTVEKLFRQIKKFQDK